MRVIPEQSFELFNPRPAEELYLAIETAGRMCWRSTGEPSGREEFVRSLIRRGHESVIEHASVSAIIGTDRGILAELTRHRLASFSVESTRYVRHDDPESWLAYRPEGVPDQDSPWLRAMIGAEEAYNELLGLGFPPQMARSVLPLAFATRIFMTANIREWRHVFKLRTSWAAHPQMRALMFKGLAKMKALYPALFWDIPLEGESKAMCDWRRALSELADLENSSLDDDEDRRKWELAWEYRWRAREALKSAYAGRKWEPEEWEASRPQEDPFGPEAYRRDLIRRLHDLLNEPAWKGKTDADE
jgi:thymidylate synthase (FAD)